FVPNVLGWFDRKHGCPSEGAFDNKGSVKPGVPIFIGFQRGFHSENSGPNEIGLAFGPPPPLRLHSPILTKTSHPQSQSRSLGGIIIGRDALVLRQKII